MTNTSLIYNLFEYAMVGGLVASCTAYCVLTLAPNALKIRLRNVLLRLPLPKPLLTRLQQPLAVSACGTPCGGCSAPPAMSKKIHWHFRQR